MEKSYNTSNKPSVNSIYFRKKGTIKTSNSQNKPTIDLDKLRLQNRSTGDFYQKQRTEESRKQQMEKINRESGKAIFSWKDRIKIVPTAKQQMENESVMLGEVGSEKKLAEGRNFIDIFNRELKEKQENKETLQTKLEQKQKELYEEYKNIDITKEDIEALKKLIKNIEKIQGTEDIKKAIREYSNKFRKLLYLISKLDTLQEKAVKLEEPIYIENNKYNYGYKINNHIFEGIENVQIQQEVDYIGLIFKKSDEYKDIVSINKLINRNANIKSAIEELEKERIKKITSEIEQCM